jgi:hypothetical protein
MEDISPRSGRRRRMRGPGIHLVTQRNVEGSEAFYELTRLLKEVQKRVKGMKELTHRELGTRIRRRIIKRYENAGQAPGDPPTAKWKPLSELTIEIRRMQKAWPGKGGKQPIKRKTLKLQRSIKVYKGKGKGIVRVGSGLGYSYLQEFGGALVEPEEGESEGEYEERVEGEYLYIDGLDDEGKKKHIRIPVRTTIPARPAIYFSDDMIEGAVYVVSEFVKTRFEKSPKTVNKILGEVPF